MHFFWSRNFWKICIRFVKLFKCIKYATIFSYEFPFKKRSFSGKSKFFGPFPEFIHSFVAIDMLNFPPTTKLVKRTKISPKILFAIYIVIYLLPVYNLISIICICKYMQKIKEFHKSLRINQLPLVMFW